MVRIFTKEPVVIIDNFFTQPVGKIDQLKAPSHYPKPEVRYTLRELSLIWYMYGGRDFSPDTKKGKSHVVVVFLLLDLIGFNDNNSICPYIA